MSTTDEDIGGLWELGVLFPIVNPNMEKFERFFRLYSDANIGDTSIYLCYNKNNPLNIKINDMITIGPSTDQTRGIDSELLYKNKYEIFLINGVDNSHDNFAIVYLKRYSSDQNGALLYNYLKDDCITVRSLANNWNRLSDEFVGLSTYPIGGQNDPTYFKRYDAMDDFKGYSQLIQTNIPSTGSISTGIVQDITGKHRSLLNRIGSKYARMSAWVRLGLSEQVIEVSNDIDENITGVQSDHIDEGFGVIDPSLYTNPIDESPSSGGAYDTYPLVYLRTVLYNDTVFTNIISDDTDSYGPIIQGTENVFLNKKIEVDDGILSGRVGVYASLTPNPRINEFNLLIDDICIEHCVGTSKESSGYYLMDMNPSINISVKNKTINTSRDALGIKTADLNGDPNSRFVINATWLSMPGFFIEDMKILEKWNKEGFPIILRTKMPGEIPNTLFCNMILSEPEYEVGRGNKEANLNIQFEEIAV